MNATTSFMRALVVALVAGALIALAVVTGCTSGGRQLRHRRRRRPAGFSAAAERGRHADRPRRWAASSSSDGSSRWTSPPIAEALLIEDGLVVAVGTRDEVAGARRRHVPVIDIGQNVAYPGFIDAHAHWIGDRDYYGLATPAEADGRGPRRGWTSISEQWVNPERIDELERRSPPTTPSRFASTPTSR